MMTKFDYLLELPFDFILEFCSITKIIKNSYNYFTKIDYIDGLIKQLSLEECVQINNLYKSNLSCNKISYEYLYNNPNAELLKKEFCNYLLKINDELGYAMYEVPIPKSRVDIAIIKNNSYAYEIKSKRDTTRRLYNQINAMKNIFEVNYIIIDENMDLNINLDNIGIYKYRSMERDIHFELKKEASYNDKINPKKQLSLFTYQNLKNMCLKYLDNLPQDYNRNKIINVLFDKISSDDINEEFKQILISRSHTSTI